MTVTQEKVLDFFIREWLIYEERGSKLSATCFNTAVGYYLWCLVRNK